MKKIALFIDIDNAALTVEHFDNVVRQVYDAGEVLYGKIYGLSDRKHKEVTEFAQARAFDIAPVMRLKKRGSKILDNRILIDIMEMVANNSNIDTVAVVCAPGDLVPLFAKLREYGICIMAPGDLDKESLYFVDEYLAYDESREREDIEELTNEFFADEKNASLSGKTAEEQEIVSEEKTEQETEQVEEMKDDLDDVDTIELLKNVQRVLSEFKTKEDEENEDDEN